MIYHLATSVIEAYWSKHEDTPGLHMKAPHGQWVRGVGTPEYARYGHPEHIYSMRPDLTRSGRLVFAGKFVSPLLVPVVLAGANVAVIRNAPQERQRGMWQMFASGLTGTFGVGSAVQL